MVRYSPLLVLWAWCLTDIAVSAAEFYAVVERNGTVALCLSRGALLFADRCEGNGRLSIVQPIKEGIVVWRSATGAVSLKNESQNAECALSHATWDQKREEVVSTGKKIAKVNRTDLLKRLKQDLLKEADVTEGDILAFALDLDNDGKDETVFVASNVKRIADHYSDDSKPIPYFLYAGVLSSTTDVTFPALFYNDQGEYRGGTDAIGEVTIKGVVPVAPGTGELALLIKAGPGYSGTQALIRYRYQLAHRIDTIEFTCN